MGAITPLSALTGGQPRPGLLGLLYPPTEVGGYRSRQPGTSVPGSWLAKPFGWRLGRDIPRVVCVRFHRTGLAGQSKKRVLVSVMAFGGKE